MKQAIKFYVAISPLLCCLCFGNEAIATDVGKQATRILVQHCFNCHGPGTVAPSGELQFPVVPRSQQSLLADLKDWINPDDPAASEIVARLTSKQDGYRMPPGAPLNDEQIQIMKTWIRNGADYGGHWAWEPLKSGDRSSQAANGESSRNPIDRLVDQLDIRREFERASSHTQLRRLALTLTGLPPSETQLERWVKDWSDQTYVTVARELIESEGYGIHMAAEWLDAARYADTNGFHHDGARSMWAYRDYVVEAFNKNIPFDQFTREQLAGDLLAQTDKRTLIATGFLRNNAIASEGGINDEEYRIEYVLDRSEAVARTWLGITLECARCHDHKYEPISQADYYSFAAFFNNMEERGVGVRFGNTPPCISTPTNAEQTELASLSEVVATTETRLQNEATEAWEACRWWAYARTLRVRYHVFLAAVSMAMVVFLITSAVEVSLLWKRVAVSCLTCASISGASFLLPTGDSALVRDRVRLHYPLKNSLDESSSRGFAGSMTKARPIFEEVGKRTGLKFSKTELTHFGKPNTITVAKPFTVGMWVRYVEDGGLASIFANEEDQGFALYLEDGHVGVSLSRKWDSESIRVKSTPQLGRDTWHHVCVTYDGRMRASGIKVFLDGSPVDTRIEMDILQHEFSVPEPLRLGSIGAEKQLTGWISDFELYERDLLDSEVETIACPDNIDELLYPVRNENAAKRKLLSIYAEEENLAAYKHALSDWRQAVYELSQFERLLPTTMVAQECDAPRESHVLRQGKWDQKGQRVAPAVPEVLQRNGKRLKDRLELADWLVSEENPLTARVIVNRVWAHHFGRGIVETPHDFGLTGEAPTAPELLDFLAAFFVDSGWDLKALHYLIVTSETFRQCSTAELDSTVPPVAPARRQMTAESIRDSLLATSGLLSTRMGGRPYLLPSVAGFEPPQQGPLQKIEAGELVSSDSCADRRTIFAFCRRIRPDPQLEAFDFADRSECSVSRKSSSRVSQSLMLMNNMTSLRAAYALAVKLSDEDLLVALERAFLRTLCRPPTEKETLILSETFQHHSNYYGQSPGELERLIESVGGSPERTNVQKIAALTVVFQTLFLLPEFTQIP